MKHYKKLLFISSFNISSNTTDMFATPNNLNTVNNNTVYTKPITEETNTFPLIIKIIDKYISNICHYLILIFKWIIYIILTLVVLGIMVFLFNFKTLDAYFNSLKNNKNYNLLN